MAGEEAHRAHPQAPAVRASCCTTAPTPTATSTSATRSTRSSRTSSSARTLAGFDAPYVPGWDCHGPPIEHQIEKLHGKGIPGDKVRELPRLRAEQVERQKKDFIRLGVLGDGTIRT